MGGWHVVYILRSPRRRSREQAGGAGPARGLFSARLASSSPGAVDRLYSLIVAENGKQAKTRRFNLLYGDTEVVARGRSLDDVLDSFETDLQLYVAENARRRTFVHAGVVGYRNRAVVIPGRSHSGKTTLVAELVRAGAVYYSDEYAVLDSRGRVHPYTRPLAIRSEGEFRGIKHPVEALGGVPGVRPLQVGLVVVSQYKQGARWRPRQLSKGEGALALLANTVSARAQPETALSTLQHVVTERPSSRACAAKWEKLSKRSSGAWIIKILPAGVDPAGLFSNAAKRVPLAPNARREPHRDILVR